MATSNKNSVKVEYFSTFQLLHPELLSTDDLRTLLKDRCIQLRRLDCMTKEELLAVVHRVAVPLPQRLRPGQEREELPSRLLAASSSSKAEVTKPLENCVNYSRKILKLKKTDQDHSLIDDNNSNGSKTAKISLKRKQSVEDKPNLEDTSQEREPKKARSKITWP